MACEHVKIGGATMIVCGPKKRAPRCRWCAGGSTALCDFQVGRTLAGKAITCDAPMCDHHRTMLSPNRDHCPTHAMPGEGSSKEPFTWPATIEQLTTEGYERDPTATPRPCRLCGKQIEFWLTRNAKPAPLELQLDGRFISHFATCPYADKFRKGAK